ncbi:cobalamin B12-binding domain-containing protein [Neotabrizicola shimadae]|uniref:Cobalamin B12-binding domain-containing protein n=1 Tax=Neotabrizicola shimadae TaxID=2807096 RepID=A0A8G0ZV78_9RHOB|nr:cobalamin B12-binding domain-containing protein [Neotabrizicola shimadae]QYZ69293.1 cobalamin B12-binding domain-containing protein [Neotabrizicola shimadae]
MRDIGGNHEHDIGHVGYLGLALEVMDRLARRMGGSDELRKDVLDRLTALAIKPGSGVSGEIVDALSAARVSASQAVATYIPEVARVLGRGWEEDRYTFAEVTIGAARLQELLHRFQGDLTADSVDGRTLSTALVVVPPGEQHTLGAMVVAMMLREKGVSVNIQFGPALSDLARLMASRRFDAALVSVANSDKAETAAKVVKTIKNLSKGRMLVAVGGPGCAQMHDALVSSGVDLITNDLEAVVSGFGLQKQEPDVSQAWG